MGSIWKVVVMYKQALFLVSLVFLSTFVRSQPVKVAESPKEAAPAKDKAAAGETPAEEEPPAEEAPADATGDGAAKDAAQSGPENKLDKAIKAMNRLNDQFEKIVQGIQGNQEGENSGAPAVDGEASDAGVAKDGADVGADAAADAGADAGAEAGAVAEAGAEGADAGAD